MRRSDKKFYQAWDRAVDRVRDSVFNLRSHNRLSPDQDSVVDAVLNICNQLTFGEGLTRWTSNTELAKKYACSVRTVTNWRKAGAPLDSGQWAMLDWLADQHCVPKRTKAKFAVQLAKRRHEH